MKNKNKAPLTRGLSAKLTGGSGITLIALIITIIVMLILAVVSIKVASDSGLFSKAETATSETEKEKIREEIIDVVMKYYDAESGGIKNEDKKNFLNELNDIDGITVIEDLATGGWEGTFDDDSTLAIEQNGTVANYEEPKNYVRQNGIVYVATGKGTATVYGDRGDIDYTNPTTLVMTPPTTTGIVNILPQKEINGEMYAVTKIGSNAFFNCTSLSNITIPSSVTTIESAAFNACTSLTSITIPASVTKMESKAFWVCTQIQTIKVCWNEGEKPADWAEDWNKINEYEYSSNIVYGYTE